MTFLPTDETVTDSSRDSLGFPPGRDDASAVNSFAVTLAFFFCASCRVSSFVLLLLGEKMLGQNNFRPLLSIVRHREFLISFCRSIRFFRLLTGISSRERVPLCERTYRKSNAARIVD